MACNGRDLESIGKRIKGIREKRGIKQEDLTKKLGGTREALSNYETGKRDLKTDKIIALAEALDVSADYLLGLSKAETRDANMSNICYYTGLSEDAVERLHKLSAYRIGDAIETPVSAEKNVIGMVTCEYDHPSFTIDLLLKTPHVLGLIYSYLCMLNDDDNSSVYQGDKGSAILFELMLELRKLRDALQPAYKEAFYKYFDKKDGAKNG